MADSSVKDDGNHVVVFGASEFCMPDISLTHGGLILIALLSGGDYHQAGLSGCGPKVAHGLAKCGFGDSLLSAVCTRSREDLQEYLVGWRKDLAEELRTNSRGILGRKCSSLSKVIPEEFPDIDILMLYANPVTSETEGKLHKIKPTWERPLDLGRIAHVCELYFEWGVRHMIIKRFRTVIWPAAVFRFLRESVLAKDQKNVEPPFSTTTHSPQNEPPSSSPATSTAASLSHLWIGGSSTCKDLITKIHSTRNHDSTDGLLEYRLEVSPERLVTLTSAGIKDIRPPLIADISSSGHTTGERDKRAKKPPPDPSSSFRVWIPACIVKTAMPSLVDSFEETAKRKTVKKTTHTKSSTRPNTLDTIATSPTPEDAEEPQKRDHRSKPNLKAFYPVMKPEEPTSKPFDKHHREDRSTSDGRSKILDLIDDLAATGTSHHDEPKSSSVTTVKKSGPSTTRETAQKIVDGEKESQRSSQAPARSRQGHGPASKPTQLRKPTSSPLDTTPKDVIEISSDSDKGDPAPLRPKPRVAPLLVARSRRLAQSQAPEDIIDLT
jgi:hypothetical protein